MSELAILVPVLNRPHRIEPLLQSIAEATTVPHRVIFGCSDQPTVDELDRLGAWYIRDEGGSEGTWPKRINRLYREVNEPVFFCGADDLAFRPGWFEAAMRVMETVNGVIAVNDLMNAGGVHFVISRDYVETLGASMADPPGVVMCEQFFHSYVDDFCRKTAIHRGRWGGVVHDSIVEHLHCGVGKAPSDSTYILGESTMSDGFAVFHSLNYLFEEVPA